MSNSRWVQHAYPLQQITIQLQGTRHSARADIINQLETVLAKLRAGDTYGMEHDDDFGYSFALESASNGPSIFDEKAVIWQIKKPFVFLDEMHIPDTDMRSCWLPGFEHSQQQNPVAG